MNQQIGFEIRQIQEDFKCDELAAVNILLQLIAQDEFENITEFGAETLPQAA